MEQSAYLFPPHVTAALVVAALAALAIAWVFYDLWRMGRDIDKDHDL